MLKSFSYDSNLKIISKNLTTMRQKEIKKFMTEFSSYNISLNKLIDLKPDFELRNIFLNISLFLISNEDLFLWTTKNKKLPVKKISSLLKEDPNFIHKWRHYILAYFILFSSEKYKQLQSCISINDLEDTKIKENLAIENSRSNINGVLLQKNNSKCCVLTGYGLFISIKPYNDCPVGGIVNGFIPNKFKILRRLTIVSIIIAILLLTPYYYFYGMSKSTVILEMEGKITIDINRKNKIISTKGSNYFTQSLLNNINDKSSLDKIISGLLTDALDNKKINEYSKLSIYVNGQAINFDSLDTTKDIINSKHLQMRVNNVGSDFYFNEK